MRSESNSERFDQSGNQSVLQRLTPVLQLFIDKSKEFLFSPASARPIASVRIGLGLILLAQAYMTRSAIWDFFSASGLLQGELASSLNQPGMPNIGHLRALLAPFGISESISILSVCGCYLVSLIFLTVGFFTRPAAITAWFLHWILMNSADSTNYGIDIYAHVFLFYMMWVPAGDAFSVDRIISGQKETASSAARLGLRVMQIQLCVTYLASGLDKAKGEQWRNGEAFFPRSVSADL